MNERSFWVAWWVAAAVSVGFLCVIAWAVVRLVNHFL